MSLLPSRPAAAIHPLAVRVSHWINAAATIVMIMSGLQIHNAHPILPAPVPDAMTIGGWLGGAIRWHFAAMWVLALNGAFYLVHGLSTGRLRRKLLPLSPALVLRDLRRALSGRLGHADLSLYNGVQRFLYAGVIGVSAVAVLSGLAIWKPVQLGAVTALMGDFDNARLVHFAAMAAIVMFLAIHVSMSLIVPRSLKAMISGR